MKLSRHDIQKLEDYWINLEEYKKQLKYREWELLNPHQVEDTNMGGGRANRISDTTGNRAIMLAEDDLYKNLQRIINGIEHLYISLNDDEKTIVDMRYRTKRGYNEWEDIAYELGYSRRKVLKIRDNLIDRTAAEINFV
ncbi:MAG: transcriptional regulator [Solibacillus sp.]|uniref:transcriptional regulator n=1 Tax=Solibacillus sp. TaxID=1909654 RepID=UPI003315E098